MQDDAIYEWLKPFIQNMPDGELMQLAGTVQRNALLYELGMGNTAIPKTPKWLVKECDRRRKIRDGQA